MCNSNLLTNAFFYTGLSGVRFLMGFRKNDFVHSMSGSLILFSLISVFILISKVMFGFIADKFGNMRNILIILLVVTTVSFFATFYIPSIESSHDDSLIGREVTAACNEVRDNLTIYIHNYEYDPSCGESSTMKEYNCKFSPYNCWKRSTVRGTFNLSSSLPNSNSTMRAYFFKVLGEDISKQDCACLSETSYNFVCEPDINTCNSFFNKIIPDYKNYLFWMFAFLYIINWFGMETMMSLTDVLCFETLKDNSFQYGKQRVWGSIGWSVAYFAFGLYKSMSYSEFEKRYFQALWVMLAFFVKIIFLLCIIPSEKPHVSVDICKNIRQIFSSLKTVIFVVGVFICGVLSGLDDVCELNVFYDIEPPPISLFTFLLDVFRYLVAEIPFFFFSGWFVKQIGHFYCLVAVLVAFSLKMGLYSILQNIWWGLLIQVLRGLTFSLFFTAMTLYAVDCSTPGTEATMLGIFGGLFTSICKFLNNRLLYHFP